jgi:hypothetical protein
MPEQSNPFPHDTLRFLKSGTAKSGQSPRPSQQSNLNRGNRDGHGRGLKSSVSAIVSDWQENLETRKEQGLPALPNVPSLLLKVDPKSFDADTLKGFGIEVVLELEDGYILGAAADADLTKLQQKIAKFIAEERGGGKVGEIWEILEGRFRRLQYILSPDLLASWEEVEEEKLYTVDVSIACVGLNPKFSEHPRQNKQESPEKFANRVARWLDKRDQTLRDWDVLQQNREADFKKFIDDCKGEFLQESSFDERTHLNLLPDSFSCQIRISGKGLKDIALTYPYVFEISEPEQFAQLRVTTGSASTAGSGFTLQPPPPNAPRVCVIDSGIQEKHPFLQAAIDVTCSQSWVPSENNLTADSVANGGHGTRVAGALLYPQSIPSIGSEQAICWIQNARVLDRTCSLSEKLYMPDVLADIIDTYHKQTGTRIFNHSITGSNPCRMTYMSAWAATIDYLSWQNDILFIVAAGNLPIDRSLNLSITRLTIKEHFAAGRTYPDYLLQPSARIANPAQSFQALTVGSIAHSTYNTPPKSSLAEAEHPSAFSCTGYGIWDSIKPDVVEYGGDLAIDASTPPSFSTPTEVCPELVRTTVGGGPAVASDSIGTSYAAPKVAHIAAVLEATFPQASCLLYRALIVQSARLPVWTENSAVNLAHAIRMMGYGLPNLARAIGNTPSRITLITQEDVVIKARQAHIYQVSIPPELQSPAEAFDIRVEITLSYKAEPRRTRRNKRKYLSNWLHWECSRKGESPDTFLANILQNYETSEEAEDDGLFSWILGLQKNHGNRVKDASRSVGTIQKDWAIVKSFELREAFCIAVVAHKGWNNDPTAQVPYALTISFEVVGAEVSIYDAFVKAQTRLKVQQSITI